MKKLILLFATGASLVAGLTFHSIAAADVPDPPSGGVTVIGLRDVLRRQQEQEYEETMQQVEANLRAAYNGRTRWNQVFTDYDSMTVAAQESDLRCNGSAAIAVGSVNTTSTPSTQLQGAQTALSTIRNSMTAQQFGSFVSSMPRQSGTTMAGQSFTNTPIFTVIWSDGSQSNFTMREGGSGWGVYAYVSWRPRPTNEGTGCPA